MMHSLNITVVNEGISYPVCKDLDDLHIADTIKKMKVVMNKKLGYILEQDTYINRHILLQFDENMEHSRCLDIMILVFEKYCEYFNIKPINNADRFIRDVNRTDAIDNKEFVRQMIERLYIKDNDFLDLIMNNYVDFIKDVNRTDNLYLIVFNINFSVLCGKVAKKKVNMSEYKDQLLNLKETYPELNNIVIDYDHNEFARYINDNCYNHTRGTLFPYFTTACHMMCDISPYTAQINVNINIYLDDIVTVTQENCTFD